VAIGQPPVLGELAAAWCWQPVASWSAGLDYLKSDTA